MAQYFTPQVLTKADVVIAPTVNCSYYPAFAEYPGWTGLRLETARALIVDICRGLARFGPKRFYVLNTGVSTPRALKPAAEILGAEGIVLRYTDVPRVGAAAEAKIKQQKNGTHADEIETSLMLHIAPKTVDMKKAVKDDAPTTAAGLLTRDPNKAGRYSPSGVFGHATLATRAKEEAVAKAMTDGMLAEIEALRASPLK